MKTIGKRILIVRLGAIGDVIRTLPALRALRSNLPEAYLAWAVEDRAASLLTNHPDLDKVFIIPRKNWQDRLFSVETLKEVVRFIQALRQERFEMVLDFHGLFKSGLITYLSGAEMRLGYSRRFCKEGNFLFTTHRISLPVEKINRVEKNLFLVKELGLDVTEHTPLIPITEEDRAFADALFLSRRASASHPFIIMHPGSSHTTPYKRWAPQRFAQTADILIQRYHATIFFTAGKDEWHLVRTVTDAMKESSYELCRTETLLQLAEIIRRCDLYIGNDTAPMHMAAFLGTPVIALFGPTDPVENAPYGNNHVVMLRKEVSCNPCRKRDCQKGICMDAIEVEAVVKSADHLFRTKGYHRFPESINDLRTAER
ncbi:MAG: glycosyltransferase family 9 protein [Deltaproteobacteria bacterium]|nr:glycosyltransferase family 9 protein [Deltaproteobacteria bacterium]